MGTTSGKVDSLIDNLTELKKIYFEELTHLVENSRWLTTLVLAEIAGIAAYRDLSQKDSLSIFFAVAVFILALTITGFMISVFLSRIAKKNISTLINQALNGVNAIDKNPQISQFDGDLEVDKIRYRLENNVPKEPKGARTSELIAIILFILGSLLSVVILFLSEILKLFGIG